MRAALWTPPLLLLACAATLAAEPALGFEQGKELLDQRKYVQLLERSLDALRRHPDSLVARYLLAAALHRGEGSFPLSQRHLEEARNIADRRGGYWRLTAEEQKVYIAVLDELVWICGETEQYREQLDLIDKVRDEIGQDWSSSKGWPLMKLGRLDEARKLMLAELHSKDVDVRVRAMNSLGAIESTAGNLEASHDWFSKTIEEARNSKNNTAATDYKNRAEAAWPLLRFEDVERDLLESSKHFSRGTYSNPWSDLALLYLAENKLPAAAEAASRMRDWDRASEANVEAHRWNLDESVLAMVLLAAGHDASALATLDGVARRPDRQGASTTDPVEAEICLLLVHEEALRINRERAWERLSWSRPVQWLPVLWQAASLSARAWTARSRLRSLVMKNDRLDWLLRPNMVDSTVPEWIRPAAAGALGRGMALERVRKLLDRKDPASLRERAYLLALLGEGEVRGGDVRAGAEALTAALAGLPSQEVMLRARVHGLLAEALDRAGRAAEARPHYLQAFEADPRVFRALGFALPVTIRSDGDAAGAKAASWLGLSVRFRQGSGFVVDVRRNGAALEAALIDPSGAVLARAAAPRSGDARESARMLCREVHKRFYAARLDFEQAGFGSLDASPASATE